MTAGLAMPLHCKGSPEARVAGWAAKTTSIWRGTFRVGTLAAGARKHPLGRYPVCLEGCSRPLNRVVEKAAPPLWFRAPTPELSCRSPLSVSLSLFRVGGVGCGGFALGSRSRAPQQAPVTFAWTLCLRALQCHCIARGVLKPALQAGQQKRLPYGGHLPGRHPGSGSAKASTGTVPILPGRLF